MPVPDLKPRDIRGAIDALKRRRQQIAFDANMFKRLRYDTPYTRTCAAEYDRITQAIAEMEAALPSKQKRSASPPTKQDDPPAVRAFETNSWTDDTTQSRLFDEP